MGLKGLGTLQVPGLRRVAVGSAQDLRGLEPGGRAARQEAAAWGWRGWSWEPEQGVGKEGEGSMKRRGVNCPEREVMALKSTGRKLSTAMPLLQLQATAAARLRESTAFSMLHSTLFYR